MTLPAICVGGAKECLRISRRWTSTRSQWGQEIGKHQALADKLARMACDVYAMEAMIELCTNIVDKNNADIRVESAMAKMWATETYWKIVDDTMQMKGGRGYETVESLENRGEDADGVERMFRDARINLIFEGSSDDAHETTLTAQAQAKDVTITIPDATMTAITTAQFATRGSHITNVIALG